MKEAGAHDRDQCAPALAANALIGALRPASAAHNYVAKDCVLRTLSRHAVREISCLQNCDTQKISRLKSHVASRSQLGSSFGAFGWRGMPLAGSVCRSAQVRQQRPW
jgi:hypothetical protein